MALGAEEDVLKRLAGIKDARGPVGQLARGNNMYPGGAQARTGGGPDIGRPPETTNRMVPPAANQALQQHIANNPVPPVPTNQPNQLPQLQQKIQQSQDPSSSLMAAKPMAEKQAAKVSRAALQAAAQRRMKR